MSELSSTMKGLFNDLTRTLFSSVIYLDDLHIHIERDSDGFDDWWLATEQLKRAIEFYLELRSIYFSYEQLHDNHSTDKIDISSIELLNQVAHKMNESLTIIINSCDSMVSAPGCPNIMEEKIKLIVGTVEDATSFTEKIINSNNNLLLLPQKPSKKQITQKKFPNHDISNILSLETSLRNEKKTILVVEDNKQIREMVTTALRGQGYRVYGAGTAKRSVEIFEKRVENIDLIFIDVKLPDQDGFVLAHQFLHDKPTVNIMLTSGNPEAKIQGTLRSRRFHFLEKPFHLNDLFKRIDGIFKGYARVTDS